MSQERRKSMSRRDFLGTTGRVGAAAAAATAGLVPLSAAAYPKEWLRPDKAEAAAGTLHFLAWSGYDAGNVTDPFTKKWHVPIDVDTITSDPAAFNQLKGGKSAFYDLTSFDMAWVPKLAKAGLVKKLDLDNWRPLAWDHYIEQFQLENYKFAQLDENWQFDTNGTLYGLPQRFGVVAAYANTKRVPEDVWSESYDWVWNPGKEYNIGLLDRMFWTIQLVMYWCNIDPFKEHTDEEVGTVREATIDLFQNAKALFSHAPEVNTALLHEEIDVCFEGDNFINGTLRKAGYLQFQTITPKRANSKYPEYTSAPNNAGGTTWVEEEMVIDNPHLHPAAYDYLAYMQSPQTALELSWPDKGPPVLVPHKYAWEKWSQHQRDVLEADYMQKLMDRCRWYAGIPDLEKFDPIWEEAKGHIGEKHKEASRFVQSGYA